MRFPLVMMQLALLATSCKKESKGSTCLPDAPTVRQITDRKAVVKLNATIDGVYLIEEDAIDTKLIPCNFPLEFYQNDLQVTISGEVKSAPKDGVCCTEYLYITEITR